MRTRPTMRYALLLVLTALPLRAGASEGIMGRLRNVGAGAGFHEGVGEYSLATFIGFIIQAALALVGVVFVAQMVYAGYLWMTARGESDQLERAKDTIRRSIVGLAIILASYGIVEFVMFRFAIASGLQ